MRFFRQAAVLVCAAAVGYLFYRVVLHVRAPVIPAVIDRTVDAHRMLSSSPDARLHRYFFDRPPADRSKSPRLVALTFDDGPYPIETPLLLDILHDLHVPATFFLIGRDAEEWPQLTRRISKEGYEIANHTLTHPADFEQLSARSVRWQLEGGADALETMVRDPSIRTEMRPPHGRFTEATVRAAQGAGYSVILWNDDPGDWRSVPTATLVAHIEQHATAPDIILLHSGRLGTVELLPEVVARFRKAGFTFVTARDLLARVPHSVVNHPEKTPL